MLALIASSNCGQNWTMTLHGTSLDTANTPAPITHYENFPVASWLCPAHLRAPIAAIYHFARTADDIADEGSASADERLQTLSAYRAALNAAARLDGATADALQEASFQHARQTWQQVFVPLHHAIQQHALPIPLLHALLDAFVQDTQMSRDAATYATEADVLDYCTRSANPVGRLLLHLYGVSDAQCLAHSDAICTALQLINFWQDLSVDVPRGRHYLSDEALQQCGVTRSDVLDQTINGRTIGLVKKQVERAREMMHRGAPLVHRIPGRAGWELRLVVQGGLRILDKIEALHYATLRTRPSLNPWDGAIMLWRALGM
jgi:squalene synthase HpnC